MMTKLPNSDSGRAREITVTVQTSGTIVEVHVTDAYW